MKSDTVSCTEDSLVKMEIVSKKVKRFDLDNCSYSGIKSFYSEQCNKRTISLFYKNAKLVTILSLEDLHQYCRDEFKFENYLEVCSNNKIGYDLNSAKAAFEVLGKVTYLIKELHQEEGLFIYKNNDFNDVAKLIYDKLVKKNVHPIRINFPMREDIKRKNRSDFYCTQLLTSYEKLVENGDIEPPYYLDKITNIKKNDFHTIISIHGKTLGNDESKTIFLVGPCITAGSENFEGEKLAQILKAKLDHLGLSYKIKCVAMYLYDSYKILEENINKNDIVFIFNRQLYENEFDLTPCYDKFDIGGGSFYI